MFLQAEIIWFQRTGCLYEKAIFSRMEPSTNRSASTLVGSPFSLERWKPT